MAVATERKYCQRCLSLMPKGRNPGALSRVSDYDEGRYVCPVCGRREAIRAEAGLNPVMPDRWPMTPADLAEEDRILHESAQSAGPTIEIDDDDLKNFYAE
jgi:hypothetical protein